MKPQFFSAQIPFMGFYGSIHSDVIDHEEEQLFTSDTGKFYDALYDDFFLHVNWEQVYQKYATAYCDEFAKTFGITLDFEELVSPREYNFQTDRIFAKISRNDLAKILKKVRGEKLKNTTNKLFSSRSGFISHYSNNIRDWGKISTWDHNQIYAILVAFTESSFSEDEILSSIIVNNDVSDWIYESADYEGKLAVRFADIMRRVY
jgi:hypothetical protein